MRKIASLSILLAGTVGIMTPAMAADFNPVVPVVAPVVVVPVANDRYDWSNFHIGINGGLGFRGYEPLTFAAFPDPLPAPFSGNLTLIGADLMHRGFFAGFQVGAQKQIGNIVLGVENDIQWSRIGSGVSSLFEIEADDFLDLNNGERFVESTLDWFGTARVRAGFALDRLLIFATGGLAYGQRTYEFSNFPEGVFGGAVDFNGVERDITIGWTAGGGAEYALTDRISVKGEYLFISLLPSQVMFENAATSAAWIGGGPMTIHTVRAGINVNF